MTRPLVVRGRASAGHAGDHLDDPVTSSAMGDGPLARRWPARWADHEAVAARVRKRAPLPPSLVAALRDYHGRLGAKATSLASLESLARGDAACAIAGQQPAPLGGPLFGLHKTASAVGIARRVRARTGVPCVPVFWNHVEDSDFDEIRGATLGDPHLVLHDLALPEDAHPSGGLVGAVPIAPLAALTESGLERWAGLAGRDELAALARGALRRARDLGEAHAALLLALFGEVGLVVVDPRMPEFRAAARPVVDRYLERHEVLAASVRSAGDELEAEIGRRPLKDAALDSFLFAVEDGRRRKISPAEAAGLPREGALSPSVALRPVVQDAVLPTVAMACGPGELAYLAQIGSVFEGLDVVPACPVPRLGATWLPPAAIALLEASGADPWALVATTDHVLRRHAESRVPGGLRRSIDELREEIERRLGEFSAAAAGLDPSLSQMVDSARSKIDYQIGRLADGLVGKARHRMEREHPEWLRLRYYLLPGDKLQERRLASLEPVAYRGTRVVGQLCDLAEEHAAALERGEHPHYVLEL